MYSFTSLNAIRDGVIRISARDFSARVTMFIECLGFDTCDIIEFTA